MDEILDFFLVLGVVRATHKQNAATTWSDSLHRFDGAEENVKL
jgi:hypothetical protein